MKIFSRLFSVPHLLNNTLRYWQRNGTRLLVRKIRQKLAAREVIRSLSQVHTLEFYEFVKYKPMGNRQLADTAARNTINWFIPIFGFGSGGHLNIFRFIQHLEKEGFNCAIVIVGEHQPLSALTAQKLINECTHGTETY